MKDYYTIGEVSAIKKISPKSLRYYERIGILIPAKVDPDNSYRYYTSEQFLTIDMIKFLAAMDIPLKEWHNYIDANGFYLEEVIERSRKIATEQLQALQIRMHRLDIAAKSLQREEMHTHTDGFYDRIIPARNVLCYAIHDPENITEFHRTLSILFDIADQYQAAACYPSGIIMDHAPDKVSYYVYLEIFENLDGQPYFRHFPEHTYRCIRKPQKSIITAAKDFPDYFADHPYCTLIESDCITSPICFIPYPTELEFY